MIADTAGPAATGRGSWLAALALACALGFGSLSVWQFQRLGWKQALMARVARQLAAAALPLPAPASWPTLSREQDEYRRLTLSARFDASREARVLASTELGRGQWVLVPAQLADGHWLWVNRGFVDDAHRDPTSHAAPAGAQRLTGLLRWTEPRGWLWQRNDPAAGRWVSRDVAALSAAAGLPAAQVAPFFLDLTADEAAAGAAVGALDGTAGTGYPRAGLTVLHFSNNHLVYALTWAALALGSATALVWLWRSRA